MCNRFYVRCYEVENKVLAKKKFFIFNIFSRKIGKKIFCEIIMQMAMIIHTRSQETHFNMLHQTFHSKQKRERKKERKMVIINYCRINRARFVLYVVFSTLTLEIDCPRLGNQYD